MSSTQTAEAEYMSLAPGVGIIPEKFRNKAYGKLEFGPGEGGLGDSQSRHVSEGGAGFDAFLAAVAAGADPQEYAKQLTSKTTGRGRGQKGA